MEIPARRGLHFRQQGHFVDPVGESALHVHLAFGRAQFIGGDPFQKKLRSLLVDRPRRTRTDRIDVILAEPHGLLRSGDLNPACDIHHAVIGRKSLHTAAFQQRLHLPEHDFERIGRLGAGNVVGGQRTERGSGGKRIANSTSLQKQPARIEHFVPGGIGKIFEIQQDIHSFSGIVLNGICTFERVDQPVFGKRGCRGSTADAKQHPQQFIHKQGIGFQK